jgi:hypothetical protein
VAPTLSVMSHVSSSVLDMRHPLIAVSSLEPRHYRKS